MPVHNPRRHAYLTHKSAQDYIGEHQIAEVLSRGKDRNRNDIEDLAIATHESLILLPHVKNDTVILLYDGLTLGAKNMGERITDSRIDDLESFLPVEFGNVRTRAKTTRALVIGNNINPNKELLRSLGINRVGYYTSQYSGEYDIVASPKGSARLFYLRHNQDLKI